MTVSSRRETRTSSALVLSARVLLLLAAAGLAVAGFALTRDKDGEVSAAVVHAYSCPMHAEVTAASPGECPICKMALERAGGSEGGPSATTHESATHESATHAEPQSGDAYVCPMHPKVTSKAPGSCSICKMALEPIREKKTAAPEPGVIPAAVPKYGPGVTWQPASFPPAPSSKPGSGPALGAPKRRVIVDDVRAAAWAETPERLTAVLYRDELVGLVAGERGRFFRSAAPHTGIDVRLGAEPPVTWDASTSRLTFVVERSNTGGESPAAALRAGDVGWLELAERPRELLVVPESALLRSSDGPYVLVPEGVAFARRPIEIGRILKGQAVVLSGLTERDSIVIGNGFFLDAQQRLDPRAEPVAEVAP